MKRGSKSENGAKSGNGKVPYVLRKSPIQGRGAFATRSIRKGERIVEYKGEHIDNNEADLRYPIPKQGQHHHTFLFELDEDTCVDAAVKGNSARFINHSCDPNCRFDFARWWLVAARPIPAAEELSFNYLTTEWDMASPFACRCGAASCSSWVQGLRHLPQEHVRRLRPLLAPHLHRRLEAMDIELKAEPAYRIA